MTNKERAKKAATAWSNSTGVLSLDSAYFEMLCDDIELALKEQDRDTRHGCAEAVLRESSAPSYRYHYYAISVVGPATHHLDGFIVADEPILSFADYSETKKNIAEKHGVDEKKLTICSLTRLG